MFQRKTDRKQLHQVDSHSMFFTSNKAKSPIEVGFADSSSPYHKPRPVRRRNSGGNGCACGCCAFLFLIIWTAIVLGCGYYYFESVRIPSIADGIRRTEHQNSVEQVAALNKNIQNLQREKDALKKGQSDTTPESNKKSKELQEQIDNLQRQLDSEKETNGRKLLTEKEKNSRGKVGRVLDLQQAIQAISKRALVDK
jgi:hypothetical protein